MTGSGLSSIDGLLNATGSIYLINPNGVIIGKTGVVNVGGTFVASTLNITDQNFLAGGRLSFAGGSSASAVNLGKVGALGGDVALVAANVLNDGTITAANGTAALVAGHGVLLRDAALNDGKFAVLVGGVDTSVTNSGLIAGANAELRAEGGNVYALAGDTAGVVRATGVKAGDGKVWLVAEGGTLDLAGTIEAQGAGGAGGQIETSGQTVDLGATSINVHGGLWTLDPLNLEITSSAAQTISTALTNGDVLEQTTAIGSTATPGLLGASGAGDITLDAGATINWGSSHTLTLSAYHDVDVGGTITSTGAGSLVLQADNSGVGSGAINFTGSGTQVNASGGGSVAIFYNPAGNNNATVNATSYTTPTNYAGSVSVTGGGVLTSYMLVNTLFDLQNVQNNLGGAYALGRDIDASATAGGFSFTPIGTLTYDSNGNPVDTSAFNGVLDGQGHSVSNLTINLPQTTYVGLFGDIGLNGVVRNINLTGGSIVAGASAGPLAGENEGTITNATASTPVTIAIYDANGDGGYEAGGLVGGNTGTINASSASGAVSGVGTVGGLAGANSSNPGVGIIENSHASGAVTETGGGDAGGLVGASGLQTPGGGLPSLINDYATGAVLGTGFDGGLSGDVNSGKVTGSYATGSVSVGGDLADSYFDGDYIGGLIGYLGRQDNSAITNVYATGPVSGTQYVGGLIGFNRSLNMISGSVGAVTISNAYALGAVNATSGDAGGLIGEINNTTNANSGPPTTNANTSISNVFATGATTAPSAVGGLIGRNVSPSLTIANGYYDTQTTGLSTDTAGGVGKTTAQLQAGLPTGFSTANWGIVAGVSYPYLLSQFAPGATPEVISGIAYTNGGVTPFASGANAPALVGVARNGASLGDVSTGVNGYFYTLAAPTGQTDSVLTYLASGATPGAVYIQAPANALAGQALHGGLLSVTTNQTTLSGLAAAMAADAATAPNAAMVFTASVTGGIATANNAPLNLIASAPLLTLDAGLNVGTGALSLSSSGAISQTGGAITAATLSGQTVTGVNLAGANFVTNLGSFANTGTGGFVFNNAQALTVSGAINGGSGGLTAITTTQGALTINAPVTGDLTLSTAADLRINQPVTATDVLNLFADNTGTGEGAVVIASGATISASGGQINIYTNAVTTNGALVSTAYGQYVVGGSTVATFDYVYTAAQLEAIGLTSATLSGDYALNGDVTMSGAFVPIGSTTSGFTGMFDGLDHTVSNLTLNMATPTGAGLFGAVGIGGVVKNLTVANADVSGTGYVGAVAGDLSGTLSAITVTGGAVKGQGGTGGLVGVAEAGSSISNAASSATVTSTAGDDVGGLVGASFGAVANSVSSGTVMAVGDHVGGLVGYNSGPVMASTSTSMVSGGSYVGGLVGLNYAAINTSTATASVAGATYLGGLVGWNDASGTISGSTASGAVTASGNYAGGLVGVNKGAIATSTAGTGQVSGSALVGGLVGLNQGTISASATNSSVIGNLYVGGLAGWNDTGATVQTSYATGATSGAAGGQDASGNDYVGGLVGVNYGSVANTYSTGRVSGVQVVGGLIGTNMPNASVSASYTTSPVGASGGATGTSFGVQAGEVTYVYGFPGISGQPTESGYYSAPSASGDGTDLTAAQQDGSTAYTGFDFTNNWQANVSDAPTLKAAPSPPS